MLAYVSAAAGPYLFISEVLDHPYHIFKSALEHLDFSSLPEMPRAFWKVQPGDCFCHSLLVLTRQ